MELQEYNMSRRPAAGSAPQDQPLEQVTQLTELAAREAVEGPQPPFMMVGMRLGRSLNHSLTMAVMGFNGHPRLRPTLWALPQKGQPKLFRGTRNSV